MSGSIQRFDEELELSRESFQHFADYITRELGIRMPEAKMSMLKSRLLRRLRALGLGSLEDYQRLLFSGGAGATELSDFIDAVTTNKTDFFREPTHFEYLTATALPELDPGADRPWPFKLWCAGCSSGEEPHTLAMVLAEFGAKRGAFEFSILATDISSRVLQHAREGVYGLDRIEPVPAPLRKKYLLRSRDPARPLARVVPALRARIRFHRLNFMAADYNVRDTFDVIFFRNVMIYFDKPTQEAVVTRLCRQLRPGGFLFVGHSESLIGLNLPVRSVASAVYRK